MKREEITCVFGRKIRSILERSAVDFSVLEEIRLRAGQPLCICQMGTHRYLTPLGEETDRWQKAYQVTEGDIRETLEYVSRYSLYAYEEELRQGFITIQGGHRVGLAGKVLVQAGEIRGLKYISFLNVRLAHQVKGCADRVLPYLWKGEQFCHTLLVSPPRMGKTTLLRDIIRQVSDGGVHRPRTVGVVDERSELGACCCGIPQNDLGRHTDVLDGCPKASGIRLLLRTMSPEILAVDEVGSQEDLEALSYSLHCGCGILATVHGSSLEDLRRKPVLSRLVEEQIFQRYVILSPAAGGHVVWHVQGEDGTVLWEGMR